MEGTMTISELPAPIQEFIDATNAGDTERFLAVFTDDAYLNDWGREFHGVDGVGDWNRTDNIGMRSHFEPVSAEAGAGADEYTVTLKVSGDRFNGTGPLRSRVHRCSAAIRFCSSAVSERNILPCSAASIVPTVSDSSSAQIRSTLRFSGRLARVASTIATRPSLGLGVRRTKPAFSSRRTERATDGASVSRVRTRST
jgi:hypothetical protein